MAIEFDCPYCTATIRVPDAYSGKQGRCPKCDTKLIIPGVKLPGHSKEAGQSATAAPTRQRILPSVATSDTTDPSEGELADNVAASDASIDVRPVTTAIAKTRRRRARLRPSRTLVIGVPVICFLVLFGIIAYSLTGSLPRLHGELVGHRLDIKSLPQRPISWSEVNLSPEDRDVLKEALRTNPESLISQFVACRLSASDEGILVKLAAQPESQWIAVDVSGDKSLAIWRRKEGPQWNRMRLNELRVAVNRYAKDKLLKVDGQQIAIDAVATRDRVALNASCQSLGFVVQAIADSTIFPCAAEDESGKLYFCLPKTVQNFVIQGRSLPDGLSGFNGEYSVMISNEIVTTGAVPAEDERMPEPPIAESTPGPTGNESEMPASGNDLKD